MPRIISSTRPSNQKLHLKQLIAQNTYEFCENTTLHGLKYVASRELHRSERWFFGLAIVTVLLGSAYYVFAVYDKWEHTPVIVGLNPTPAFIMKEAFPAVTICNLNQAVRSKAMEVPIPSARYNMLKFLCKQNLSESSPNSSYIKTNWNNYERFIMNISQPCNQMILSCQFGSVELNCSQAFYPILTDEGFCCVFNMLHPDYMYVSRVPIWLRNLSSLNDNLVAVDWNAESGYPNKLPANFFPRRTLGPGVTLGVNFVLDVQSHDYYCGNSNSIGFKVLMHPANELPSMREAGILIEPGKETKIRLRTDKTETDWKLRSMRLKYRRCLFRGESELRYYAHYTQRNCERECDAEQLIEFCGCRAFHTPSVSDNISICTGQNEECVRAVRFRTYPRIRSCIDSCLPACFALSFISDVFSARLDQRAFAELNPQFQHFNQSYLTDNIAVLNTYFKEYSIRSQLKTEFIGTSDFLSSVGGLLGLFIGFSFISLVELIYFGIWRPGRTMVLERFGRTVPPYDHHMSTKELLKSTRMRMHPANCRRTQTLNSSKFFFEQRAVIDSTRWCKQRPGGLILLRSMQNDNIQFIN